MHDWTLMLQAQHPIVEAERIFERGAAPWN
nr:MAG TPA: hypothetical protein [Caudoviricetes sp.]